jgi:hypothetical protein
MIDIYSSERTRAITNDIERCNPGWEINVSRTEISIPERAVGQGYEYIHQWQKLFPRERTWVQENIGIPSLIVRFDATMDTRGNLQPYEIEERPGGIGVTTFFNEDFRKRLTELTRTWPPFQVVVSDKRTGTDDGRWAEEVRLKNASPDKLCLVRAEPDETEFHHLEHRSISSLISKGDRFYGVGMGFWSPIHSEEEVGWEEPFALKLPQGSKGNGFCLWIPGNGLPGVSTKDEILKTLQTQKVMYQQPYFPPIELNGNGKTWYMIHRIFYGYDLSKGEWDYLGGFYNARQNLVVYGSSDAIFGPVVANDAS